MTALGPFWIVALVAMAAGVWKLIEPAPTRLALRALGVGVPLLGVRALGAFEATLAATAVVTGHTLGGLLLAAQYLAFAAVAWALRGRDVSCGCFGAASTRATNLHVVVDLVAAATAGAAALASAPGLRDGWPSLPGAGVPTLGFVVLGAVATIATLTVLPAARQAVTVAAPARPVLFQITSKAVAREGRA